jgi:hypothetical protein
MISRLAEEPNFDRVTASFTEANQLSAFDQDGITVHASSDPDGLALTFRWDHNHRDHGRVAGAHLDIEVRTQAQLDQPGQRSGVGDHGGRRGMPGGGVHPRRGEPRPVPLLAAAPP